MAWPVGVTLHARARCPDVVGALLALRDAYGTADFYRREYGTSSKAAVVGGKVQITTREEVALAFLHEDFRAVDAFAEASGLHLYLLGTAVEATDPGGSPESLVRKGKELFSRLPVESIEWRVQVYDEWDGLGRVVAFCRELGVGDVTVDVREDGRFVQRTVSLKSVLRGERPWNFEAVVGQARLTCQPKFGGGVAFWIVTPSPDEFLRLADRWRESAR